MDLVLRRYFWAFTLAFLALAAFLVARTVNLFVESAIAPEPSLQGAAGGGTNRPPEAQPTLNIEKLAHITGMPLPAPEPEVAEAGHQAVDLNAAPVKSDLRVKLLGTLQSGIPEWSLATIQDLNTQRPQDYRIGDKILGAEVLDIERGRVIVLNNNRREYIANDPNEPPQLAVNTPVRPPENPGGPALGSGIRATGENTYEVPRAEIDRTLGDLNQVAMQARIVPAFKDGQAQGFKLFSIRPDSIYSKIGVVNGDVIKRINGFELNSPEKALEIYSKLKEANRIDIEIDRNGTSIRKQYTVR